jgi:ligand-binding sensor domain-containing protein
LSFPDISIFKKCFLLSAAFINLIPLYQIQGIMAFHKIVFFFIISMILVSNGIDAQDVKFEYLTPDEGLSQSSVMSILRDKDGFMWFGTQSGLNKYDGYKFTKYYHSTVDSTSLAGDLINCLFEDSHGDLWIGTDGGLSLYDRDRNIFVSYRHNDNNPNSLSDPRVFCMYEDKEGRFWIGTTGGGLNLFNRNENKFTRYMHKESDPKSISNNAIHGILEDADGNIWVGTENGGLDLFDLKTQTFTHFMHNDNDPGSIAHSNITSLVKDRSGSIWIGTLGGGICRLIKVGTGVYKFETFKPVTADLNRTKILALFANQKNGIWVGTENGGLDYFDCAFKTFKNYQLDENTPNSLNNNSVHAIYEDKTGNLWVGTYTGGVNVVKKNTKKIYTYRKIPGNPNSLSYNAVSCFFEDNDGTLWVGTDGGGVNLCDRTTGQVIHYNSKNTSILANAILAICKDQDQDIWLGGWECGLNLYNRKSKTFTTFSKEKNGIPNNNIFDILTDRKGRIWMCFGGLGFAEFHKSTRSFTTYTPDNSKLNSVWVLNLTEAYDGNIVLGHTNGFSLFNPENQTFENYSNKEKDSNSLSNNQINIILSGRDSALWIGSINGLNRFEPKTKKFTRYFEKDGLPNNNITGLVEDDHGYIWISTANGISKFDPKSKTFKNYKLTDGLQGKSYIRNSCNSSSRGEIMFGGTNGYNIFYPDSLHDNPSLPPVVITDFTIFNKPVIINGPKSPLTKDISQTKKLTLNYKQSVFSFEFVALDYTAPSQNQYAYKLDGFDEEWIYSGTKRTASYTNLNAGSYTFRVKGSNNDGKWNEEGVSLQIKVKPPIWKTWWFRIAVVLLIFYIIYAFFKQRMNQAKHDKEILEHKIKEGEALIQQKVDEVEKQTAELKERDKRELEIRFMNEGIAKFSNIIVSSGGDINKMSSSIISGLVSYVGIVMGAMYVVKNEDPNDIILELESSYAVARDNEIKQWKPGEGYVGTCYAERNTLIITNIPKGYAKLASGLGETIPDTIYLIPLKYSDTIQGVLEVASLKPLDDFKLKFLEKIAENITSFITIAKANKQTETLLIQADIQRNELQAQEEELKQNLEEMMATQDEMKRREEAWIKEKELLKSQEATHITELQKLKKELKKAGKD